MLSAVEAASTASSGRPEWSRAMLRSLCGQSLSGSSPAAVSAELKGKVRSSAAELRPRQEAPSARQRRVVGKSLP